MENTYPMTDATKAYYAELNDLKKERFDKCMNGIGKIMDNKDLVLGEIYKIKNTVNGECYVGQTLSHHLNHKKYRPYGYNQRLKTHISFALCKSKGNGCSALMNAMREYGTNHFEVELLLQCLKEDMDTMEQKLIEEHNTVHPNGYNITAGGKKDIKAGMLGKVEIKEVSTDYVPRSRNEPRTEETKAKQGKGIKEYIDRVGRENAFQQLKEGRTNKKMELFKDIKIEEPLEQYIRVRKGRGNATCTGIVINGKQITSFYSNFDTQEESNKRAIEFLQKVIEMNQK